MTNYFRITAYHPTEDISVIMDSNGMFEKLWQFSSLMVQKGFKIIEVGSDDKFLDVNIEKAEVISDKLILRANAKGQPETINHALNGYLSRRKGRRQNLHSRQGGFQMNKNDICRYYPAIGYYDGFNGIEVKYIDSDYIYCVSDTEIAERRFHRFKLSVDRNGRDYFLFRGRKCYLHDFIFKST